MLLNNIKPLCNTTVTKIYWIEVKKIVGIIMRTRTTEHVNNSEINIQFDVDRSEKKLI